MSERNREEDFAAMVHAATVAINDAVHDGERVGKNGTWQNETVEEQLRHIEAHITQYQCGDRNEDHLSHIVSRAAIAVALRLKGSNGVTIQVADRTVDADF